MRVLLELLRIVFLFIFGGALVWVVLAPFYNVHPLSREYQWLGALGVYGILFVFYRNRWQFSGWYKGKGRKKLPLSLTRIIIVGSMVLIASPWVMAMFNY
ncbi:hypothetical protein GLW00_16190 [Halobacillus litoralis]|uniref:Uncharacterized protein n=1 Tax=Halobacillus litoralis TaxID=45668 RepID=A0A845FFU4_9BACI|nr:hypothetical protein [Halobacillus litoralis]MYL72387.1 hypothetical protein [Halobacillus litoralis]